MDCISEFNNTYANSDNVTYMMEFNDKQIKYYNNDGYKKDALFKISWTLTPNGDTILDMLKPHDPHSLLELADIADAQMANWTQNKIVKQNLTIGNIFIYDNYPNAAIEQILNEIY